MFSDHTGIKLENSNNKMSRKALNIWKLSNTLYKTPCFREEITKKLYNISNNDNKKVTYQIW